MGGLHRTARSIESTVRQRDALVTLGTLAAGLAHEINNPAAAATRTVDDLGETVDSLLDSLGRLAHDDISAEQFAALDDLRRSTSAAGTLDALALADLEDALTTWLERHGVPRAVGARRHLVGGRHRPGLVRPGARRTRRARARARPGVGGRHDRGAHPARRAQGLHAPHLRAGRRGAVLLPGRPRVAPAHRRLRGPRQHADHARPQAAVRRDARARVRRRAADRRLRRRAQPGVDQPHRQRRRRHGGRGHADGRGLVARTTTSSSRSPTPARACRPRCSRGRSSRSSPPRTSARAPGSASTSRAGSWSNGTEARSTVESGAGRPGTTMVVTLPVRPTD